MSPLTTESGMIDAGLVKRQIDDFLHSYFDQRIAHAHAMAPGYGQLWRIMTELNQAGGKRLRPYLAVVGYQACSGDDLREITAVAAAWELLHLCLLIHDDIIDEDLVRYGRLNVAGTYRNIYAQSGQTSRSIHIADSAAIIAGDLALSSAHDVILSSDLKPSQKILAQQYLTAATFTVAGGELLDTESVLYPIEDADPDMVATYKTASYSFVGPLTAGAALAGTSEKTLQKLENFGTYLGCAYQLTDDVLGVFGDTALTGKSNTGDLAEGKRTAMLQYVMRHARSSDKAFVSSVIGTGTISEHDAARVRQIMSDCGARQDSEQRSAAFLQRAIEELDGIELQVDGKKTLQNLITLVSGRRS